MEKSPWFIAQGGANAKNVIIRGRFPMDDGQWTIGMPSVIAYGNRLALLYDAPGGTKTSHMLRNIGLAWLDLPLKTP